MDEGYKQAKEQIAQLEAELTEFQASSRELEKELELELEESESKYQKLQDKNDELTRQLEEWKAKHLDLNKEYATSQASLQKQVQALSTAHKLASNRLREIEMTNDDMERHERITKTSLDELEKKYHKALEDIAMLESEVASKEDIQIELQRTKDELRDTKEELSVANNKIVQLQREAEEMQDKVYTNESPTGAVIRTHKFRITSDPSAAMSAVTATASTSTSPSTIEATAGALMEITPIAPGSGSGSGSGPPPVLPRMTSSKSLRKIHGMLDQMRNLETRVHQFKSSLPKPVTVTPTKSYASPTTTSPNNTSPRYSKSYSPPGGSNLPVSSSRRNSSITVIDRALTERHAKEYSLRNPPQTKFGLDPIQGSPSTTPLKKKSPSSNSDLNQKLTPGQPRKVESNGSMKDHKHMQRPGSAFSALHSRAGIGHGRFV